MLVPQAAHQTAAAAADLGGVEGKALLLGHPDGHRLEILQKPAAAEGLAAQADASHHLALVPHADLPQLDPHVEGAGQVLHQLPEVHPAVGGEVEGDFGVVGGILHLDQLHLQAVAVDALPADPPGLLVLVPALVHPADVHAVGQPHQAAQGAAQQVIGGGPGVPGDLAADGPLVGVGHHIIPGVDLQPGGVKIGFFSVFFKTDGNCLFHGI